MANRTYLYAADSYPGEALQDGSVCDVPVNLTGVAEWNWEIPALAETLVSANPKVCQSTIWDGPFGIVGDFDGGVARALELLQAVTHPGVSEEVSTAIRALESASTRRRYLILETAEVFALDDDPVDEQVRDLRAPRRPVRRPTGRGQQDQRGNPSGSPGACQGDRSARVLVRAPLLRAGVCRLPGRADA